MNGTRNRRRLKQNTLYNFSIWQHFLFLTTKVMFRIIKNMRKYFISQSELSRATLNIASRHFIIVSTFRMSMVRGAR
jgi:hypothetical protein